MLLGGVASPWPWDEIAFIFSLPNLLTTRAGLAGSPWIVPRGGAGAPTFGTPGRLKRLKGALRVPAFTTDCPIAGRRRPLLGDRAARPFIADDITGAM